MKTPIMIGGQKIGRLRASFLLFKESWRFLRSDKELLLVPVISLLFSLMLLGLLTVVGTSYLGSADALFDVKNGMSYPQYGFLFGVYVISAFSLALAQAITVHIVYIRAHGGDATLGAGIARALGLWAPLLLWAVIAGTVGLVLRTISERSALIGKIVTALLGAAWSILTFFVVPVMVLDKQDAVGAIKTSAKLFKQTWGETLVANITLGLVFMVAHLLAIASFVGLIIFGVSTSNAFILIFAIFAIVIWLIAATLVNSALQGILKTLLYIYAAENVVPENFNRELLESMLVRKTPTPTTVTTDIKATTEVLNPQ